MIHTVGPVWQGGHRGEALQLTGCYRRSLELAAEHSCRAVAFPAISTGVYGYPKAEAAEIAVNTVQSWLAEHSESSVKEVLLVCFDGETEKLYKTLLNN